MAPFVEEQIVPFPTTLADEPSVTHCRGTLIMSSRRALQRYGHFERYRSALPAACDTAITSSVAGAWLPIELGVAHYRACDSLLLPIDDQLKLGATVVHELQRTFIGTLLTTATKGAGVSPLLGLQKFFGVYARSFKGGGGRLVRIGPKDIRVEFVGNPIAGIRYFRVAYRGFITAGCEVFARRVVAAELSAKSSATAVAYRVAWA
jgi:hypothetical protein